MYLMEDWMEKSRWSHARRLQPTGGSACVSMYQVNSKLPSL